MKTVRWLVCVLIVASCGGKHAPSAGEAKDIIATAFEMRGSSFTRVDADHVRVTADNGGDRWINELAIGEVTISSHPDCDAYLSAAITGSACGTGYDGAKLGCKRKAWDVTCCWHRDVKGCPDNGSNIDLNAGFRGPMTAEPPSAGDDTKPQEAAPR